MKTTSKEKTILICNWQLATCVCLLIAYCLLPTVSSAQSIGINTIGAAPNASALLDVDAAPGNNKGLLLPRLSTAQRNAIVAPAQSLLIYNTTDSCYQGYIGTGWVSFGCVGSGCTVPSAVTASAAPNPVCAGSTLTLTGGATGATTWSWTGPNTFTSTLQSPTIASITTAGAGVYTLTASNTCGSVPATTASVIVVATPTTANAGPDINPACGVTTATLAGNTPLQGMGVWTVVSGTATITTPSSPTSGVTGLAVPDTATLRWTISNAPCADSFDDVVITTTTCFCGDVVTTIVDVFNPATGKTWMDRNLGASQVATSSTDAAAYGDLYQWGRCSDGHEKRTSGNTSTLSPSDTPGHGNFIKTSAWPEDWRSPQNNSLWQGVGGTNNPCPTGYRLPTEAELDAERLSWATNNAAGAFGSPLKLTTAGERGFGDAILYNADSYGIYWSSTVNAANANNLTFWNAFSGAVISNQVRAHGESIRCIKN